ncbi:hypothetical protein F5Y17DRAFT_452646 [Xylariaceae sp. FL0594]|nr:hypothetical protein F5Y17DRAFT_452646 [Xylariaceae sp. FL0594]
MSLWLVGTLCWSAAFVCRVRPKVSNLRPVDWGLLNSPVKSVAQHNNVCCTAYMHKNEHKMAPAFPAPRGQCAGSLLLV